MMTCTGWDDCSDTPVRAANSSCVKTVIDVSKQNFQFLFNVSRQTVVTYDDTYSLADKAKYAKQAGMAGCFTWSLDQVFRDALMHIRNATLTDAFSG